MSFIKTLLWYMGNTLDYVVQMLPCMLMALLVFWAIRPVRKARLERLGLVSSPWRECGLALFVVFCAGLASLTLFPANLWSGVIRYLVHPVVRAEGLSLAAFYPTWEQIVSGLEYLPLVLTPFREIARAPRSRWLLFMLLGNIGMFLPVGLFSALLWNKARWWRSVLVGFCSSVTIEFIQFFIGRSTDIDDVILNTTGALAGYWVFLLINALFPKVALKFRCRKRKEPHHELH